MMGESTSRSGPDDPAEMTLTQLRDAIAAGQVSATQAVKACLARIDAHEKEIHAFNEVFAQQALDRAQDIDRRLAAGDKVGALAGCPIALKDNICTSYGRTTCSSRILENYRSPFDATAVQRLEAAGAIVIGKTNLDEFAMGSSVENSAFGPTRNPWDRTRVPGGSSGGSAAAVAAGFCHGALGSDTGGSIRQPAALTGLVGFKPTYGVVSRWGLVAFASSLDQIGPFGRTAGDAALLMSVMAGPDPLDTTSNPQSGDIDFANLPEPTGRPRIGLAKQYMSDENDAAVSAALAAAMDVYRGMDAEFVEVDLPTTRAGVPVYYVVATAEASSNLARFDGIRYGHRAKIAAGDTLDDLYCKSRGEGFGPEVQRRIMLGTYALSSGYYDAYYNRALKVRRLIKNEFDRAFEKCDAILCPTTPTPAFRIGEKSDNPLQMYLCDIYTVNVNLAGLPGVSFPGGLASVDGKDLPVGLQFIGPAFSDARLLGLVRRFECLTHWWQKRPAM